MKRTHLQSSTGIIEVSGTRILTDPWLVDGAYYGSWYHFPPCPFAPEDLEYDYIYISHIHPDHMRKKTLARRDRSQPVLFHTYDEKFLKRNLEMLGFQVTELAHGVPFSLPGGGGFEGVSVLKGRRRPGPSAFVNLAGRGAERSPRAACDAGRRTNPRRQVT